MHRHATTYRRVGIASWSACSPAGDAEASLAAVLARRPALVRDPAWGWLGRLPGGSDLDGLAAAVADAAWRAAGRPQGRPAIGLGSSKGDVLALVHALAGAATGDPAAWAPGACSAAVARRLALGPFLPCAAAAACSTGLASLLAGADQIEHGRADVAVVGAAEASLTPLVLAGFANAGVLCGDRAPEAFASPTGFAPAEGAAALVLVEGAAAWRLVAGVRLGDAGHETRFTDPATLATALHALWACSPRPDLIVCHATGTAAGDAYELAGLAQGPWADVPRLCCKPFLGHSLGASGAVELALALASPARHVWKLSLGFGGHLVAVACQR